MDMRIVGARLPRTGTASLKVALEHLLGSPCYHMFEVFAKPEHIAVWHQAARGELPAWPALPGGLRRGGGPAGVGSGASSRPAGPAALIVLSVRDSAEQWWDSATATVFNPSRPPPPAGTPMAAFTSMVQDLWRARIADCAWSDRSAMKPGNHARPGDER
jgi:hypothetical protein